MKKLCLLAVCLATCAAASAQVNFGSVNIGSSATATATATITSNYSPYGALITIGVLTGGAFNLDFTNAGGGSCTTGTTYPAGATCTVQVTFTPTQAGARYGAVVLWDGSGTVMAFSYLQGNGVGPQTSFSPAMQSSPINATFYNPGGLAADDRGGVYAADGVVDLGRSVNPLYGFITTSSGRTIPPLAPYFIPPHIAVDGAGNVYGASMELTVPPNGGLVYASGGTLETGAVDGAGNIFSLCKAGLCKYTLQPDLTYVQSMVASGTYSYLYDGIAVDGQEDVFVAGSPVYELIPSGSGYTQISVNGGSLSTSSIAVDGVGNLYWVDSSGDIFEGIRQPDGSFTPLELLSGVAGESSIGVDSKGDVSYFSLPSQGSLFGKPKSVYGVREYVSSEPGPLTYASTLQGSTSSPQTMTILNSGNAALEFSAITFPADFNAATPSAAGDCSASTTLAVNESCALRMVFAPVAPVGPGYTSQTLTEQVLITTDAGNMPGTEQAISVSGVEIPKMVVKKNLLISPLLATRGVTYGQPIPPLTGFSASGLVNGDTIASALTGAPVLSTTATSTSAAGYYPITVTQGSLATTANNYTFSFTGGRFYIYKALLTGTIQNVTIHRGNPIPAFTYTLTGFVNGDTQASAVTGAPILTTTATSNLAPGKYPITGQLGTLAAHNYVFTAVNGTLTILP